MGLYALGKTAALASIKAAVDARVSTLSDGSLGLDVASLSKWLAEQGDLIISQDVAAGNVIAAKGVLATVDVGPATKALDGTIAKTNWQSRADWPTNLSVATSQGFVSTAVTAQQDMVNAAGAIETYYTQQSDALPELFNRLYEELGIDATLPATEDRYVDSRYYVYTYVTDRGEESAPSPVSDMILCDQNDTATVVPAAPPSGRDIAKWRIYRTNTGAADSAFQYVSEVLIDTLTYLDEVKSSALQEVVPSITWSEPPSNLQGLTGMPNGVMAGFYGNTVAFCEPNVPYAWPEEYRVNTEHPIVAQAAFGQTLVVGTHGSPYYISGADSASMSAVKMDSRQSCVSARSMVAVDGGVVYASPDGLCLASGSGIRVITLDIFNRTDWRALNPSSLVCAYHDGVVYFYGSTSVLYALNIEAGKLTTVSSVSPTALYVDNITDRIYAASGSTVYALFSAPTFRTGDWKSKRFVLPTATGFAWLVIESDFSAPITVKWYGDGSLVHTATVSSRAPVRLPAGEYQEHEIEITSTARWNSLTVASSTSELQGAQ